MTTAHETLVVGAGVSGLTTAICLAELGRPVRVRAARPPQATTSMVAGALWGPSFQEPAAEVQAWTRRSLEEFRLLASRPGSGVRMAAGRTVTNLPMPGVPPQAAVVPELRRCAPEELPPGFAAGFRGTMPLIDMPRYLDHLRARLAAHGVEIEVGPVATLEDAAAGGRTVVNCAGLGARELARDASVRPVRGQHVMVRNPGLDEFLLELGGDEWVGILPHPERVVLGGNSIPDTWDTAPDPAFTERLLERCAAVEPRLGGAQVIEAVVGLRPDRPAVRVEREPLGDGTCVHNYGHGGNGVSLSWGCARAAAALVVG